MNYTERKEPCRSERRTNKDILPEEAKSFVSATLKQEEGDTVLNRSQTSRGWKTFNSLKDKKSDRNKSEVENDNKKSKTLKIKKEQGNSEIREGDKYKNIQVQDISFRKFILLFLTRFIFVAFLFYFCATFCFTSKDNEKEEFQTVSQYCWHIKNTIFNNIFWVGHFSIAKDRWKMQTNGKCFESSSQNNDKDDGEKKILEGKTTSSSPVEISIQQTTNDLYGIQDFTIFTDTFGDIRKSRDYSYHTNYKIERQQLQDEIIGQFLSLDPETRRLQEGKDGALDLANQRSFYIQCPDLSDEEIDDESNSLLDGEVLDESQMKPLENLLSNEIVSSSRSISPTLSSTQKQNEGKNKEGKKKKEGHG